ncbi:unnamed protein product [Mucor fragilis]
MKLTPLLAIAASTALLLVDTILAAPTATVSDVEVDVVKAHSKKVITGYFPSWLYKTFLPNDIDFSGYTHINYAFTLVNNGSNPFWSDPGVFNASAGYSFQGLVKLANEAGTKVMISCGGWNGGLNYSSMAASPTSRQEFIKWNIDYIATYNLAGVDLDWEYPNDPGSGCNQYSPEDASNFLLLIKELREALDKTFPNEHKEITLAVYVVPWGPGQDEKDVSAFVPHVDRFQIMLFELDLATDPLSGPNAPFMTELGIGFPYGFVESIEYWHAAGVPYKKLVGGVAFFGRARKLLVKQDPTTQYNPAETPFRPFGDQDDGPFTNPYCPANSEPQSGAWKYTNLRSQGLLPTPTTAAVPWIRHFDEITKTPWLYNPTNQQYISYDDPVSIGIKTQWAIEKGLAGLFCWSVEQDNGELLDAMRPILECSEPSSTPTKTVQ